jgi:hypothetical protein
MRELWETLNLNKTEHKQKRLTRVRQKNDNLLRSFYNYVGKKDGEKGLISLRKNFIWINNFLRNRRIIIIIINNMRQVKFKAKVRKEITEVGKRVSFTYRSHICINKVPHYFFFLYFFYHYLKLQLPNPVTRCM